MEKIESAAGPLPNPWITKWKETRKVIGYFCSYISDEVIIEEQLGIPSLTFEVDCIDSRPVTSREIKRKLKLFLQSLE